MSDQNDNEELATLRRVNAELGRSLERCRVLLRDCKEKLAANSNESDEDEAAADQHSG